MTVSCYAFISIGEQFSKGPIHKNFVSNSYMNNIKENNLKINVKKQQK